MYLQLAQNDSKSDIRQYYVTIPPHLSPSGKQIYIREDYFYNLPDDQLTALMVGLAPFQPPAQNQQIGVSLFGKKLNFFNFLGIPVGLGKAAQERAALRDKIRLDALKAKEDAALNPPVPDEPAPDGTVPPDEDDKTTAGKVLDVVKNVLGNLLGAGQQQQPVATSFNWTPVLIGGGLLAVVGTIIYVATKPKS